jgi:hypothetical protein
MRMCVRILLDMRSSLVLLISCMLSSALKEVGERAVWLIFGPPKTKFLVDSMVVYTAYEEVVQKPELARLRNRCVCVCVCVYVCVCVSVCVCVCV